MKRSAAEHGCLPANAPAAAADGAAVPIPNRLPSRRVTAVLLLAAAALDLTRCGLVAATVRQAWEAAMPMSVGLAAAAVSIWTARGCQRGARWSGWAVFLIGAASAPQASASGFSAAYTIPDGATAVVGCWWRWECWLPRDVTGGQGHRELVPLRRHSPRLNTPLLRNVLVGARRHPSAPQAG
jgi:hypothetical protein